MAGKDAIYEAMIYQACDKLLAARKRVSLRNLIAALPNGGTNRIVGPILREWKADRDYRPRLVVNDLPEAVQGELVAFTRAVVEAAQASQAKHFGNDRKKLDARLRANDELRDDALTECDFLREENVRLAREAAEVLKLRAENERMRARLDWIRAEEFWDRVMAEVAQLMPVGGTRPLEEILAGLKESVHRGARLHKEPLDVDTLKKKMIGREKHGKYFEKAPDGTLVRKVS